MNGELHPDRSSYEMIWKQLIEREIDNYKAKYVNCISINPNAKEDIWEKYVYFNSYCKSNYMVYKDGKLDRHKVAACYMISIAMVSPMRFIKKIDGREIPLAVNETLAITVGLSLLRAFAIADIKTDRSIETKDKEILAGKFEQGIKLPDSGLVNHGKYIDNYANEIHYAVSEGKISVLSLAHELYLLEVFTRIA